MSEVTRKELIAVAKELNEVLQPEPKIKLIAVKTDKLQAAVETAGALIAEGDKLTPESVGALVKLGVELPESLLPGEGGESTETETKTDAADYSDEDLVTLAGEINKVLELDPAIVVEGLDSEKLERAIKENSYHQGICEIYTTDKDSFTPESWALIGVIGINPIDPDKSEKEEKKKAEKPAKKEQKTTPAKTGKEEKKTGKSGDDNTAGKKKVDKKEKLKTRDLAVGAAIESLCIVGATKAEIMVEADKIFVEWGGKSNPTATNVNRYILSGLLQFNVLTENKGVLKLVK